MTPWSWQWWLAVGSMGLLMFVGILLMIVILLQRGRGGGLAGAFGGAGGQSAFGTRAGDVFTKITAVMAIIWVFLAGVSRFALEPAANQEAAKLPTAAQIKAQDDTDGAVRSAEETDGENADDPDSTGNEADDNTPMKTSDE
jgi:preprotein translocase subunit SecG